MESQQFEQLPVTLTREEREAKAQDLAQQLADLEQLETRKKSEAARIKDEIDGAKARLAKLGDCVRTGKELRQVPIEWSRNHRQGTVDCYRLDDGTFVRSRPMTEQERQMEIEDLERERAGREAQRVTEGA